MTRQSESDSGHWADLALITVFQSGMTQLLLLGKVEYGGGPIFKVVLEC